MNLLDIAWLVPSLPIAGGLLIALLLASFTRTVNRLTKPVSYFLISCFVFSILISATFFLAHLSGNSYLITLKSVGLDYAFDLHIDMIVSLTSSIFSSLILIIILYSVLYTQRREGYVLYLAFLALFSGIFLVFVFSGTPFQTLVHAGADVFGKSIYT